MAELNKRDLERLKGIKQCLIDLLIEAAKNSPYEYHIPQDGGLRTTERQNELFKAGKSKKDGYVRKSNHQLGMAFDIFLIINKKASWDKEALEKTARHIQEIAKTKFKIKLYWGGDWDYDGITKAQGDRDEGFVDYPHFEIR